MRILAVNWLDLENPQAGGAEVHFFEIFGRLVAAGHEVDMITSGWLGSEPRAEVQGVRVHRFGRRYSFTLRGRGAVRRALGRHNYDVVVEDINKLPLYLPSLTNLPIYVIVPHLFGTTAFREAPWPMALTVWLAERPIPRVYRRAAFHAISQSTGDDLKERGVAAENIRVIYPGVDTGRYRPDRSAPRAAEPTFLYVGRIKRYKGIEIAIRAVAAASARGCLVRLIVAGQGGDRPRLERLASALGVAPSVRFLGFVSEERKLALLREAWAVVFPSPKEGWGITNLEAAACGTPAIASDSPGLRESVRHEQTGILVPHNDAEGLAAAMCRVAEDRDLVERLGAAALTFAESLSWETTAGETAAHLEETVRAGTRGLPM